MTTNANSQAEPVHTRHSGHLVGKTFDNKDIIKELTWRLCEVIDGAIEQRLGGDCPSPHAKIFRWDGDRKQWLVTASDLIWDDLAEVVGEKTEGEVSLELDQ